jgi:hypothetical protein
VREFVGVKSSTDVLISRSQKREALMFSRVAIPDLNDILHPDPIHLSEETVSFLDHLEWLLERGIIFQPPKLATHPALITNDEYTTSIKQKADLDHDLEGLLAAGVGRGHPLFIELFTYADYLATRYTAIQLRELEQVEAYPIIYTEPHSIQKTKEVKTDIVQIAFNTLPVPDDTTSWEQIIEYRSDPDSQNKFLDLRHWMSEVARGELTPVEVEEKLEYLISQYQRHMKLHRMKANQGVLQTIVVSPAEFAENLIKFKWGQIAQNLFSIKQRRIALMEGELTSPGSEVAYIVKAKETFS